MPINFKKCFKLFLKRPSPRDVNDEKKLTDRVYQNTHLQFILMIKHDSWDEGSISFKMHKVTFNEQTYGVRC